MLWLERKYLSMVSANLQMAKWKGDNTLNHRCNYCGDSQKNLYKARGYHFVVEQSFVYKCHNCGKSTSSQHFLKDHFPTIHKEFVKELLQEKGGRKKTSKKVVDTSIFKFTPRTENLNKKVKNEKLMTIDNLGFIGKRCHEVAEARDYLESRKIPQSVIEKLWYVASSQSLSYLSPKYRDRVLGEEPRIVLPFTRNGELIGVSGRSLNKDGLRYLTMRFQDDIPLIFNIDNVDKTKTIFVTEGPIDSLFLPNSVAVGGSDFKKLDEDLKENAILVYDNEPRSTEIIKKIEEVIDLGYSVCIWNDKRVVGKKDINDIVMSGLTVEEIVEIIKKNTHEGLSAKLKLQEYKKV